MYLKSFAEEFPLTVLKANTHQTQLSERDISQGQCFSNPNPKKCSQIATLPFKSNFTRAAEPTSGSLNQSVQKLAVNSQLAGKKLIETTLHHSFVNYIPFLFQGPF